MQPTRSNSPELNGPPRRLILRSPVLWTAAAGWLTVNVLVLAVADDRLPFDWPSTTESTPGGRLVEANVALAEVLLLIGVTVLLTRRRTRPDVAARAPERSVALTETLLLLAYGASGLALGFALARSLGWHPFGFHLAGTLYGTHDHVGAAEAVTWALYNLVVYAVLPLLFFRRRYSAEQLNLRSSDRRADALLIGVVLVVESAVQFAVLRPELFDLGGRQLLLGVPATFALYFAGTVLPAMVFLYAILLPRLLKLTGSTVATVVLGGLAYTVLHLWDAWTLFTTPGDALLSVSFLLLTYFAPGMMKSVLTLRTGNAWVHVWAYHAFAPHTLADTPHVVRIFRI
ncbi:hypothetical protein G6045_12890 [Streptomyces sp. YC504]|uniref:Uncharacterized protein n=1 Tax=Streptomyces mesophilus TaxID=1775132 RepID=A0A6G4XH91_9ACTN|nr:hypothetical protein [Streptomyces mesophilus]NGO76552.1 hypothetical protein [Streptomyces mesophilus]